MALGPYLPRRQGADFTFIHFGEKVEIYDQDLKTWTEYNPTAQRHLDMYLGDCFAQQENMVHYVNRFDEVHLDLNTWETTFGNSISGVKGKCAQIEILGVKGN